MNENVFRTTLKLSKYRVGLLIVNSFLSVYYISVGFITWSVYVLAFIAFIEIFHVVDVYLQKSYLELDRNTLTISKWLFGKTKVFDLNNYEEFKGRQKNDVILNLVATNPDNPKDYIVIFNSYKNSLNEVFNEITKNKNYL